MDLTGYNNAVWLNIAWVLVRRACKDRERSESEESGSDDVDLQAGWARENALVFM